MSARRARRTAPGPTVLKAPTGIQGLDEITGGGLPKGRPTLICGGPGCGKTILAMEFLINGAQRYKEPGVFMSFEESVDDLALNFASLGFDPRQLAERKKLWIEYVRVEPSEIQETGAYDLDGLFIRLAHAIDSIGAKRVVLDTIETLFSGLADTRTLRAELRRLFNWLRTKGVTAIITGERGNAGLTRHGLEEYISDCVILLDHRVVEQNATRRLRVMKYRGSPHGANESPFFIDDSGISVLPIASLGLQHPVSAGRVSSGVPGLDEMLSGRGYFRGSSVLVSGTAGAGKTSVGGYLVDAACRRGESALFFAFEESPAQITRNLRSIGLDLEPWLRKGLLEIHATRTTTSGLEGHLNTMHRSIEAMRPRIVIVDPISNLISVGTSVEVRAMLARLIDFMKVRKTTALFTSLTVDDRHPEETDIGISSFMDTWLMLGNFEINGERNRMISVLKSRGMPHSNQAREFVLTKRGLRLIDGVRDARGLALTGARRMAHSAANGAPIAGRGGS
ncbi:MAG TPA: circadian clock protein KaiC [Gemmatimonadaceae bacterium]|nr:circadian clock protein KaiC [Gemmatimonadaceae bacterium]